MQDSQLTELSGRHFLIAQLVAGGLEVAVPVRDRGIDLIAYLDLSAETQQFVACPIQMKASQRGTVRAGAEIRKDCQPASGLRLARAGPGQGLRICAHVQGGRSLECSGA